MTTQQLKQLQQQIAGSPVDSKLLTTERLLAADKSRATDILLQLKVQFSRTVSSVEVKR